MAMGRRFRRAEPRGPQIRINRRIRVPEVRVVGPDGANLGVLSTDDALRRAEALNMDLVEVNPKASPPVCKILDFGKFKYEEKKKQREAKRKQTVVEVKELKLRPKTDDHDLNVKMRAARKFIESGNKVKVTCRFRGREITHPERAKMQLDLILAGLEDISSAEQAPTMEGRTMAMTLGPKPQVMQRLAAQRALRERDVKKAEVSQAPSDDGRDEEEEQDDEGDEDDERERGGAVDRVDSN
ncbi:MAG: translation initiation factor IF-3 [Polyangiaceae bacterium]|nr:translation initiation factor IF-3 [Polyangiaceae bacterium]